MTEPNLSSRGLHGFRWLVVALVVVLIGGTIAARTLWRAKPAGAEFVFQDLPPVMPFDESGFLTIYPKLVAPRVKDPLSLEHIRDCYQHAAPDALKLIEEELARDTLPPKQRMERLFDAAQLHLFAGTFNEAAAALEKARALVMQDPKQFGRGLTTVIFLQGVAALRRGETENCVECQCEGSCIFPIQIQAVHGKKQGSHDAIKFFSEYLHYVPGDIGARWLLNLAYMTVGEYPDRVPPEYLLSLEPFRSEADIGRFTDIAPALDLNHLNQAGGAILDDFDNDGLLDLVVTSMDPGMSMLYYRNKGDGTFEERSKAAGMEKQLGGLNCVQTDYNNDGYLDIYVARGGWTGIPQKHSLLRNNEDGTFTDVTKEAGLLVPIDGQVAVWADYDNDGFLDLFVGGETVRSRLFHNRGNGTFEEVALQAGVACEGFFCKGANWCDFNGDRYPDLFVNGNGPPKLFRNNRDGTFTNVADDMGIRQPTQGFACWFFDYDNDGWPDIFAVAYERRLNPVILSHLGQAHEGITCRLYRNLAGKGFEDVSAAVGLDKAVAPMGCNFMDVDNDGFLDIYLGTGTPQYSMLTPHRLFKNVDGKRFVDITTSSGTGHLQKGHSVAAGDWDRDGNVDIFEQLGGATPGDAFHNVLFQNPGHDNHWITVKLVGKKTNRAAIGARIKVVPAASNRAIYRHVTSGSSFGGNPLQQTIGIGKAATIASLEVYWPTTDTTQTFHNVPVDQAIEITEFETAYRRLNWTRVPLPK
jgi:hypothetical protein